MKKSIAALLIATATAAGCSSDSNLNPFNWFGRSKSEKAAEALNVPRDARPLIDRVTQLNIARQPGGAIVEATGLPPSQGWWEADLLPADEAVVENGVLTLRFVVRPPLEPRPASTPQSRELTAAVFLSDIRLQEVRKIVVQGASNSMSSSR